MSIVNLTNPLAIMLDKSPEDFTRKDLLRVIQEKNIERITFHYTGIDSQLKELKLPCSNMYQAEQILACGERVDGSSLFKGLMDASNSDLYVVPCYSTAFISPFDAASLNFMCRFLDRDGQRAPFTPDNILALAHQRFKEKTGLELWALGEIEFFLIGKDQNPLFKPARQTGYHASSPFFINGDIVNEMIRYIAQITGSVKYAHAEVGFIDSIRSDLPFLSKKRAEQHEIEFLTTPIEQMGDFVALARWIIRNVAFKHGMLATFAPKLEEGVAGNGFHVHCEIRKNNQNVMTTPEGELSQEALHLIGGLIHYASTLSSFGNTLASAYLRLVPNQEAPTRVCWSDSNRSALIRVPLGWRKHADLAQIVNPQEDQAYEETSGRQTVEIRSPDGSAQFNLLLAGITLAAEYGITHPDAIELAHKTKVDGNIFQNETLLNSLEALPGSCVAAARLLQEKRHLYEDSNIFPSNVIDLIIKLLTKEDDLYLNSRLGKLPADERLTETRKVMHSVIHRS